MDKANFCNPNDQLRLIFQKMGKLSSIDLSFVQTPDAFDYLRSVKKSVENNTVDFFMELDDAPLEVK